METEIEEIFSLFGSLEEKKMQKNQLEKQPQQPVWLPQMIGKKFSITFCRTF